MIRSILIVPDSLKGSCSAQQAANAIAEGLWQASHELILKKMPLADGGEGTMEAIRSICGGEYKTTAVCDPLRRKHTARYLQLPDKKTAVIEVAETCGLTLLSQEERDPMRATTSGLGEQLSAAYRDGNRHFIVGLGGSATCDAGAGMIEAIGGNGFGELLNCTYTILCDVNNPLYGKDGAACVFAPQKGANTEEVKLLDDYLRTFARLHGEKHAFTPGAGAAGGLGYAFLTFFHAHLYSGIDYLLHLSDFDRRAKEADLIVTAEGRSDKQTLSGKVPFGVLQHAKQYSVPVVVMAGEVRDKEDLSAAGFADVLCINTSDTDKRLIMQETYAYKQLKNCARGLSVEKYITRKGT
ncbi:MAG TPA: glycerate kinase [Bacteroidales bacterium]|nr:glycerate kinase [Bacteroidales bacterium]